MRFYAIASLAFIAVTLAHAAPAQSNENQIQDISNAIQAVIDNINAVTNIKRDVASAELAKRGGGTLETLLGNLGKTVDGLLTGIGLSLSGKP
ncbi:hypothetical protein BX661DRAFT_185972 [Kickxella alabastrina]|uniref:uncharacterized protein n=1 Tax=Kickxella alabastrina TaxID=61397 RepID=UPI00221FFA01|nr:uncharacterized protein BX661DRAFT_185972 [Kickxella alabastrina]KAI7823942.1 hypothetical protein BX661DRAFT_185972 [Kickxella alabastrina]KAJ1939354.1 hypothetical protein GGF37_004431 [Kickxella alabastrina]